MKILIIITVVLFFIWSCTDNEDVQPVVEKDITLSIDNCLVPGNNNTFDIITWNLKTFPLGGESTMTALADMITKQNADVIALQELGSEQDFTDLLSKLEDWEGAMLKDGSLNLGFIYKKTEVTFFGNLQPLFENNSSPFPRAPVMVTVKHTSGMEVHLINLHLKCCGGSENEARRREASQLLKNYVDINLPNEPVVVLGDFNDLIVEENQDQNVFLNLIEDSLNYKFADMDIALNKESEWSYPSWPSHIDHILVTNELFENIATTNTITFDNCDTRYKNLISDHRPLQIQLLTQ